jgi:sulfur relay (sulfurtransferase) DsrC/TusE family protein
MSYIKSKIIMHGLILLKMAPDFYHKDNWEGKLTTKELYTLFPKGPAKQAGKIAGLPETKRKGGY